MVKVEFQFKEAASGLRPEARPLEEGPSVEVGRVTSSLQLGPFRLLTRNLLSLACYSRGPRRRSASQRRSSSPGELVGEFACNDRLRHSGHSEARKSELAPNSQLANQRSRRYQCPYLPPQRRRRSSFALT